MASDPTPAERAARSLPFGWSQCLCPSKVGAFAVTTTRQNEPEPCHGCQTRAAVEREIRDAVAAALEAQPVNRDGCPCHYVTPCSPDCSCANPFSSTGCERCCTYGSIEQRVARATALEAQRADTERLDWLSKECGGEGMLTWSWPGDFVLILEGSEGQTLRDAIDAASRAKEGKP